MYELVRVTLENEMDLILAHKRSMKLAEIMGLSLSGQTTFATAVSEVSRNAIDAGKSSCLILNVQVGKREQYIVASINNTISAIFNTEGLEYAKRLVSKYNVSNKDSGSCIELYFAVNPGFKIDLLKIDEWRRMFRNEPAFSPYEEIKRKNEQLQDLSAKLQKSEAQYKTLTNALPLVIFSLNLESEIIYANEWLYELTGQSAEELNKTKWQSVVDSEDYPSFAHLLKSELTQDAEAMKMQLRVKSKAGTYIWHQISLSPFKSEKGQLLYWIGYLVDIHSQKVFEETLKDNAELRQAKDKLQENQRILEQYIEDLNRSNEELQQFAFVASHDLQEPVRKLLFYSDRLLTTYANALDTKGVEFLKNLHSSASRMRTLISDLLTFSQINKEGIKLSEVDLNEVLEVTMQDLELLIQEKKVSIKADPLPVLKGDEGLLRQLFSNLITNAVKYSDTNRKPVIKISSLTFDDNVEILFEDNGIGFDTKFSSQIFVLFKQLHNKDVYGGTGLGLAICKRIAEMHNGKIWAESSENAGATFHIQLPLKQIVHESV